MPIFYLKTFIIICFSLSSYAADLMPKTIKQVITPGRPNIEIDGRSFVKTSSVFEYQYENVKVETEQGPRDTLILDLDSNVVGFSIVIYTEKENYGYVYNLADPKNQQIISVNPKGISKELLKREDINGRGQILSVNATMQEVYKEISITPVPNSDLVKIIPGKWKFSIAVENHQQGQRDSFRVSVFVKKTKKIKATTKGQVSLNAFSTVDSAVGESALQIEQFLNLSKSYLKNIGIGLVIKNHKMLDSKFDAACDDQAADCYNLFLKLIKISSAKTRDSGVLNTFFLKRNNNSNYGIANLSGAVSTLFSDKKDMFDGVFVWSEPNSPVGLENASRTFVHELAHQLGLYHTDVDNISDTKDFSHWIDGNQKPITRNIMNVGSGIDPFSKGQQYVLLRAVAVELYEPVSSK